MINKSTIALFLKSTFGAFIAFATLIAVLCQGCSSQERLRRNDGTLAERTRQESEKLIRKYNNVQHEKTFRARRVAVLD